MGQQEEDDQPRLRVRIRTEQWQEFEVTPEWFGGEVGDRPDELWEEVCRLYTETDPNSAWEILEDGESRVTVERLEGHLVVGRVSEGDALPGNVPDR